MREELNKFKEMVKEYDRLYYAFCDERTLFNSRVDELCEEYGCYIYPVVINEEQVNNLDLYENAKIFFNANPGIITQLNNIKKLNGDANRNRLLLLCTKYLSKNYSLDFDTAYSFVSNYAIFSEAGYYRTVKSENAADNSLRKVSAQVEVLKDLGLTSIENVFGDAKKKASSAEQEVRTILEPYAAEAKTRLEPYATEVKKGLTTVVDKAKPFVHDGSKELAKVFTKLANRTRPTTDKEEKND